MAAINRFFFGLLPLSRVPNETMKRHVDVRTIFCGGTRVYTYQ